MKAELKFIGNVKTPYNTIEECPNNIQPNGPLCQIALYDEYQAGLSGLEPGQYVLILYWLAKVNRAAIHQAVGNEQDIKGVFALRSPHRPNPIGAAVLPIEKIEAGQVTVRGLDCLNNTQLIDIKPAIYNEIPSTS